MASFDLYVGGISTTNFSRQRNRQPSISVSPFIFSIWRRTATWRSTCTPRATAFPFCIYAKTEYAPLVKLLGLKYNFLDMGETEGSFDYVMDPAGIDNLCIECGQPCEYNPRSWTSFCGILRLLAHLG